MNKKGTILVDSLMAMIILINIISIINLILFNYNHAMNKVEQQIQKTQEEYSEQIRVYND